MKKLILAMILATASFAAPTYAWDNGFGGAFTKSFNQARAAKLHREALKETSKPQSIIEYEYAVKGGYEKSYVTFLKTFNR